AVGEQLEHEAACADPAHRGEIGVVLERLEQHRKRLAEARIAVVGETRARARRREQVLWIERQHPARDRTSERVERAQRERQPRLAQIVDVDRCNHHLMTFAGFASLRATFGRTLMASARLRLAARNLPPHGLRSPSARCAKLAASWPPLAFGSLRETCRLIASARLRLAARNLPLVYGPRPPARKPRARPATGATARNPGPRDA